MHEGRDQTELHHALALRRTSGVYKDWPLGAILRHGHRKGADGLVYLGALAERPTMRATGEERDAAAAILAQLAEIPTLDREAYAAELADIEALDEEWQ